MRLRTAHVLAAVCLFLVGAGLAYAADVTVECNKKKTTNFTSINTALATLAKQGPNTIHVSGPCKEAVVIDGFDNLTLIAAGPGTSISDPTPSNLEDNDVVDILESRNVTVQGFTINGGVEGVACFQFSVCYLRELTVQGASDSGVFFGRSSGFVDNSTITGSSGNGVSAQGSVVRLQGGNTINANGANGVVLRNTSTLAISGADTITANGGNGVALGHLSFLRMGAATISGNAAPDVNCSVTTAKTQGTGGSATPNLGGGTTNCTEPAP